MFRRPFDSCSIRNVVNASYSPEEISISDFDFCILDRSNPKKGVISNRFYISNSLAWQQVTNIESDLQLIVIKILHKLASAFIVHLTLKPVCFFFLSVYPRPNISLPYRSLHTWRPKF